MSFVVVVVVVVVVDDDDDDDDDSDYSGNVMIAMFRHFFQNLNVVMLLLK